MAKIFLSVPVLEKPELLMMHSMYQSILSCRDHQIRIYFNSQDSLISRVRNVHMSVFLNEYTECDYFMSLDSDLEIVNAFATNNIFSKLIAHDKEFVGGLYALKQNEKEPLCSSIPMSKDVTRRNIPFNSGLLEMRWLSSGCWCLKRSAVQKMVEAYPQLNYTGDDNVAGKPIHGLYIPEIFEVEENGQKFKKYLSEDWSFPVDPNTKVLCSRFLWKKIRDVSIGETIIAFDEHPINGNQKRQMLETKVIDKVYKNLPKIKITTEDGDSVITTSEHPWLIKRASRLNGRKGRKNGTRMCPPQKSYWEKTENLNIGDFIYKPINNSINPEMDNIYYRYGYINGVFDGDGCISKHPIYNSLRISLRVCDMEIIERVSQFLHDDGIDHKVNIGKAPKFKNHNPLHEIYITSKGRNKFLSIYDGRINITDHDSDNFCKGYMSGIYDAEGNYDGACVTISQKEFPTVVEKIRKYSTRIGFKFYRDARRFRLTGVYNVHDFFMKTLPAIHRKMNLNGQSKGNDRLIMPQRKLKIISIEKLEENGEMICLVTESHTFIANGFASHNCERWRAIGGQIFSDTSIVLRHIGKTSHALWKVEIVAHKSPPPETVSAPIIDPSPKIIPLSEIKTPIQLTPIQLTQQTEHLFNLPKNDVPPAGFDLDLEKENKNE